MHDTGSPLILRFGDPEAMAKAGASLVASEAAEAVRERGVFTLALSGGSTPRRMFELLAGRGGLDWGRVQVFWVDERCVGPDDAASNYRLARETLLDRVSIPAGNVHRMPGETSPCAAAADGYEQELRRVFAELGAQDGAEPGPGDGVPAFDLIHLGMGGDGHTASLFPGSPLLGEERRLVAAVEAAGSPPVERLTLTLPVLNAARAVLFLVSDTGKGGVLDRVLRPAELGGPDTSLPAALVRPAGTLVWMIATGGTPG
jgi:6-phosphogluconolactonase